jgi:thiol-disulfide isomerase/thioredoxin
MTTTGLKIAHITIDGKEIDEETDIKPASDLTQESSKVLAMYNEKKPMFIKFYANWCGHCKTNDVFWKELVKKARGNLANANIAIVEVESKNMNKDINKIIETEGLKEVSGFPTIGTITYPSGKAKFTPYEGDRKTGPMFEVVEKLAGVKKGGGAKHKCTKTKCTKTKRTKRTKRKHTRSRTKRTKRI